MTATGASRRILLVDDEEALAWSLASRLARVRPQHRVATANDGPSALALMQEAPVDLLAADIRMPGMSGIDLVLAARRAKPELPVIVMTAFSSVDLQQLSQGPFTGLIEKPFEFERLLELIDQALAPPTIGFSGAISVQTLPDIVQLYVLSSASGMLTIKHKGGEGRLWFDHGAIVHASAADAIGDQAFYEIMMWTGGDFSMRADQRPPERSMRSNWQELLMESCRRIDEVRREQPATSSRRGWTHAPPSSIDTDQDDIFAGVDLRPSATPAIAAPITSTPTASPAQPEEKTMNIKDGLAKLNSIDGFVGAALVDSESGMLLGSEGGGSLNLEVAAAGNTEVVRAKRKTMTNLALKDQIEDILISLGRQYHLIRPLRSRPTLFFYVALDRARANLAMARISLADVEKDLQV
jgi:CheY-like chemotaxis protein